MKRQVLFCMVGLVAGGVCFATQATNGVLNCGENAGTAKVVQALNAVATCASGGARQNAAGTVEIKSKGCVFKFAAIDGESELPLKHMHTGGDDRETKKVRLPRYWIASAPITARQFAEVMGTAIPDKNAAEAPIDKIDWLTAYEFCRKFNERHADQLPKGFLLQLPTTIEWAHAIRVLRKSAKVVNPVGCLLFMGDWWGGFLSSASDEEAAHMRREGNAAYDAAVDYFCVSMREKREGLGIRPVLSPLVGGDGEGDARMVTRGIILTQHGWWDEAKRVLKLALEKSELSDRQKERAENCLEYLDQEHEADFEDWFGLVTLSAEFAARKGYAIEPYAARWSRRRLWKMEDKDIAAAYEKTGIEGSFMRIGDLPPEARRWQHEGEKGEMSVYVGEKSGSGSYSITSNTLVQVLKCDFNGDGRKDLVVEEFDAVGSGGYCYNFFLQTPSGSYTNVLNLQTVGLCAIPSTNGTSCAFIHVAKVSNPVLRTSLITYKDGKMQFEETNERPFCLTDAKEDSIYVAAPFIGGGFGLGWLHLRAQGFWYRPLFWPWKPGTIQDWDRMYAEAKREVESRLPESENEDE